MKRQIRNGVFETNSSSVHSLVYSKDGLEPSKFRKYKDGLIRVDFGQFGKEYALYNSQYDKLSYLMTLLSYMHHDLDSIYESYDFDLIKNAVCKHTGAKGIKILNKEEPYIDHQSVPYYDIDIINIYDENQIINFVFNKNIILKTDCD